MLAVLTKYRAAFNVGLQSNLVYRVNFALRGFFSFFHLIVVFILWSSAYAGNPLIGGFRFGQTLTYFVAVIVAQFAIGAFNEDYQISEEIRNGLINQFLTKPVNYFAYRFSIYVSARAVTGALIVVPLLLAYPLLRQYLVLPHDWWRFAFAAPALLMSALIQFGIAYCFGLLTFWFLEIQGFVILSFAAETLLSGQIFPLDLMPPALFHASQYLPFYYMMYFPAAIFTGRLGPSAALGGLAVAAGWVALFVIVARVLWRAGLRKHTAVGG